MIKLNESLRLDATLSGGDDQRAAPKVYRAPQLTVYGSVAKLTMNGVTSTTSDAGANNMSTML